MKTIGYIAALTTLVVMAMPAEAAKKRRDSGVECAVLEQTGTASWRPWGSWSENAAKKRAWKQLRADVVKQKGGEMRMSAVLLEKCDPVNTSERYVSCRVRARFCKAD